MKPKPPPRGRGTLRRAIIIVILVVLAAVLVLGRPYLRRLQRAAAPIRSERVAGHDILLQEMHDLARLHTLEYRYRTVFPFDYMPPEISLDGILTRLRQDDGRYHELISPEERDYLAAYNLVHRHGIGSRGVGEFLVLDVVVSAGFAFEPLDRGNAPYEPSRYEGVRSGDGPADELLRLESSAPDPSAAPGPGAAQSADTLRRATVTLPPAVVTQVRIEDIDPEHYPYPEIALTPQAYREIAEFVRERATARVLQSGILQQAELSGRRMIETLLREAGIQRVEFAPAASASAADTPLYTPQHH